MHGEGTSASGRNFHDYSRPPASGALQCGRSLFKPRKNRRAWGCGKDARWKSQKADFPTSFGNPANCAGFPLSHSYYGCWLNLKPDISLATKTGHFNLLPTGAESTGAESMGCVDRNGTE